MTAARIAELVTRNALFVVSHSGGKDSQSMLIEVMRHVPRRLILVLHVDMLGMEWPGTLDHLHATAWGLPVHVVSAGKSLLDMVRARHATLTAAGRSQSPWPSPGCRQCTSDLKRGPIQKFIRNYLKAHPEHNGIVVDCIGLRAEESADRADKPELELAPAVLKSGKSNPLRARGREWWTWLPVHIWTEAEVFAAIAAAGQEAHYAYILGASRVSCVFCIMSSVTDLRLGAEMCPDLYAAYAQVEQDTGFTMDMRRRPLEEVTGIRLVQLLEAA